MEPGIEYPGLAVVFLCHDDEGNMLMGKRSELCRDERGKWEPGSGALKLGENVEEALFRELQEEYRTRALEHSFLGYRDMHRSIGGVIRTHWVALDFLVRVERHSVSIGEPRKCKQIGWFTIKDLPSPLHSQFPCFLKKHREKLDLIYKK